MAAIPWRILLSDILPADDVKTAAQPTDIAASKNIVTNNVSIKMKLIANPITSLDLTL